MSRLVVALAIRSGIPVSVWLAEDDRVFDTAIDLLRGEDGEESPRGGPQMSG